MFQRNWWNYKTWPFKCHTWRKMSVLGYLALWSCSLLQIFDMNSTFHCLPCALGRINHALVSTCLWRLSRGFQGIVLVRRLGVILVRGLGVILVRGLTIFLIFWSLSFLFWSLSFYFWGLAFRLGSFNLWFCSLRRLVFRFRRFGFSLGSF